MIAKQRLMSGKYTCIYICDIENAATMEIVMSSKILEASQPAICDVMLHIRQ